MSKPNTKQPRILYVSIPAQWIPPGDRIDSRGYNRWVDQQLAIAADPKAWLTGLLVTVNEHQIRNAIERGERLVRISSGEIPPGLTTLILEAAGDRLKEQGYTLPSLIVEVTGVGR
jgi:hypothetical protein